MQERQNTGMTEPDTDMDIATKTDVGDECSLEKLFAEAESLIGRMEEPDLPLEEAFAAYEQGMKIIRACNSRIDQVEQKMLVINEEGRLAPFAED